MALINRDSVVFKVPLQQLPSLMPATLVAIACGEDENWGRVVVISGHDRFVADGFSEFVDRYTDLL